MILSIFFPSLDSLKIEVDEILIQLVTLIKVAVRVAERGLVGDAALKVFIGIIFKSEAAGSALGQAAFLAFLLGKVLTALLVQMNDVDAEAKKVSFL